MTALTKKTGCSLQLGWHVLGKIFSDWPATQPVELYYAPPTSTKYPYPFVFLKQYHSLMIPINIA